MDMISSTLLKKYDLHGAIFGRVTITQHILWISPKSKFILRWDMFKLLVFRLLTSGLVADTRPRTDWGMDVIRTNFSFLLPIKRLKICFEVIFSPCH